MSARFSAAPKSPRRHDQSLRQTRRHCIPTGLYDRVVKSATAHPKAPEATRRRLLEAAVADFYGRGFQSGSVNHIVQQAGATSGALFHHFDSKQDLGYDVIGPLLLARWLDPLADGSKLGDPCGIRTRDLHLESVTNPLSHPAF